MPASPSEQVAQAARRVLDHAGSRPPTLGTGRLICVDGPAGSGKTTLAGALAALVPGTVVVHTDELLDGWRGLPGLAARLVALLAPLARGDHSAYLRYDWLQGRYVETVRVEPTPLLVLEGVGSGARAIAPWCTALVWVSAPAEERLARWAARDGAVMEPFWRQWVLDEAALFDAERPEERADVVVDTGARDTVPECAPPPSDLPVEAPASPPSGDS